MSLPEHASRYAHGPNAETVIVPSDVAAWLVQNADLRRLRTEHRGVSPRVDAVLMALTVSGLTWAASVSGRGERKRAEVRPKSEWMDSEEVAVALNKTSSRVRQLLRSGALVGEKHSSGWRVHRTDLEHYRKAKKEHL